MASSSSSPKLYDAFISHRDPDVKHGLAKQLYERLQERGCRAFLDREEIEGGESIPLAIRRGICSSLVQIAIFSKGYAESSWCLDELVLMLQQTNALFIPVFYDVQPWELRHIQNEKSQYGAAFTDYRSKGRNLDKLDEWKSSLEFASNISGYELKQHQDNLCEKIVSRVLQVVQEKENTIPLHIAKYPVGLAELVQDFESSCSKTERDRVTIVGMFGLGGVGKSTLAKEFFNNKRSGYDASCFLSDVRESHANRDLHSLQSQLLDDLFKEKQVFRNVDYGIARLKHRLGRARHLDFIIVLDDVDHRDQLDALLPEAMLSPGSLVIITTRDQGLLTGTVIRYRMKEMSWDHAKNLFCSHAFGGRDAPTAYEKLIKSFVEFCGCLPLSLKVLGAHLYGRDEYYWGLALEKVKNIQPNDIMQSLKISFDGLDSQEKQIFMDIACFFNKNDKYDLKKIAISIWKASGWSAEHAIQTLQDKCLVEVHFDLDVDYAFEMHDHLRDLGRQMAEDFGPPRLWKPELLRSMEAKGFKQVLAETKGRCLHMIWDSSLEVAISYFIGSLSDSTENELLWLDIHDMNGKLESIPSWIPIQKLRYLSVHYVKQLCSTFQQQIQIDTQATFQLRKLTISESPSLENLPNLIGKFIHLEELEICNSMEETDIASFLKSLQQLCNLRLLQLMGPVFSLSGNLNLSNGRDPINLRATTSSRMNSLETIECIHIDNISRLVFSGEMCPRLKSLKVVWMENLNEMDLQHLERLNNLQVYECPKLGRISGLYSLTGLQSLHVRTCPKLETISGLSSRLQCEGLKSLSHCVHLRCLERIEIGKCHHLQSMGGLEELQGLKSLLIQVPEYGDASVWNCISGLTRLPSEFAILIGKPVDGALNFSLFSEWVGRDWEIRMNSSAITVYVLFVTLSDYSCLRQETLTNTSFFPKRGEWMVIGLVTAHNCNVSLIGVKVHKGYLVNFDEEEEALGGLQMIVKQFFGQSTQECD